MLARIWSQNSCTYFAHSGAIGNNRNQSFQPKPTSSRDRSIVKIPMDHPRLCPRSTQPTYSWWRERKDSCTCGYYGRARSRPSRCCGYCQQGAWGSRGSGSSYLDRRNLAVYNDRLRHLQRSMIPQCYGFNMVRIDL